MRTQLRTTAEPRFPLGNQLTASSFRAWGPSLMGKLATIGAGAGVTGEGHGPQKGSGERG